MFGRSKPCRKTRGGASNRRAPTSLAGREVGRRGEGHRLDAAERAAHLAEERILRPEVVPPLRDAMRLVDRQEAHVRARQPGEGGGLRRGAPATHREGAAMPSRTARLTKSRSLGIVGRGEAPRLDAVAAQLRDLVAHQRDKRGDDDGEAAAQERRKLVAQRLAPAGRHDGKDVLPSDDGLHDRLLAGAEPGKAEDLLKDGVGVVHGRTMAQLAIRIEPPDAPVPSSCPSSRVLHSPGVSVDATGPWHGASLRWIGRGESNHG